MAMWAGKCNQCPWVELLLTIKSDMISLLSFCDELFEGQYQKAFDKRKKNQNNEKL